jgi:hypothetical protein
MGGMCELDGVWVWWLLGNRDGVENGGKVMLEKDVEVIGPRDEWSVVVEVVKGKGVGDEVKLMKDDGICELDGVGV